MTPADALTDTYARQVGNLSAELRRRLLRVWDQLSPWGDEQIDEFHRIAKPLVEAAAQASVDLSVVYVESLGYQPRSVSELIVPDASARLYDPADRINRLLGSGSTFEEATVAARQVIDDLGHDTVFRSARQSYAEAAPAYGRYQRRVTGKSCQWCLSLAGAVFPSAADATFGHAHCDCLAVESDAVAAHNQKIIDQAGGDIAVRKYRQVNQLKRSEKVARKRQAQAKADQATETDPARRERLSKREQEWETRRERAAERLRLLTAS